MMPLLSHIEIPSAVDFLLLLSKNIVKHIKKVTSTRAVDFVWSTNWIINFCFRHQLSLEIAIILFVTPFQLPKISLQLPQVAFIFFYLLQAPPSFTLTIYFFPFKWVQYLYSGRQILRSTVLLYCVSLEPICILLAF